MADPTDGREFASLKTTMTGTEFSTLRADGSTLTVEAFTGFGFTRTVERVDASGATVRTSQGVDGSTTRDTEWPDGRRVTVTRHADGSSESVLVAKGSDGSDYRQTTTMDSAHTESVTLERTVRAPDGLERHVTRNPDGTTEVTTSRELRTDDGRLIRDSRAADGTQTTTATYPDGRSERNVRHPDGSVSGETVSKDPDGTMRTVTTDAQGNTETSTVREYDRDGSKITERTMPDGSTSTGVARPDGSEDLVIRRPNGVIESRSVANHADGTTVITSTDGTGQSISNTVTPAEDGGFHVRTVLPNGTVTEQSAYADGSVHSSTTYPDKTREIVNIDENGVGNRGTIAADGSVTRTPYPGDNPAEGPVEAGPPPPPEEWQDAASLSDEALKQPIAAADAEQQPVGMDAEQPMVAVADSGPAGDDALAMAGLDASVTGDAADAALSTAGSEDGSMAGMDLSQTDLVAANDLGGGAEQPGDAPFIDGVDGSLLGAEGQDLASGQDLGAGQDLADVPEQDGGIDPAAADPASQPDPMLADDAGGTEAASLEPDEAVPSEESFETEPDNIDA